MRKREKVKKRRIVRNEKETDHVKEKEKENGIIAKQKKERNRIGFLVFWVNRPKSSEDFVTQRLACELREQKLMHLSLSLSLTLSQLPEMFSSIQSKSLFFFHFSLLSFFLQMEWTNCEMKPSFGTKRLILKERLILHLAII